MNAYAQRVWGAMESGSSSPYSSDYAKTFSGKLELFLLTLLERATRHRPETSQSYWYGAYNAIALYRSHPSYSPFVQPWEWSRDRPLETAEWDLRDVMIEDRFLTQEEWDARCETK